MSTLPAFFDAMRPFLLGQTDVERVEASCGPSPSGSARLAFYRRLVRDDHTGVLDKLYPFTRRRVSEADWRRLGDAYLVDHVPDHWEMNRLGAMFPAWLAERLGHSGKKLEAGERLPPYLAELAEYEWTEFSTYTHPAPDPTPHAGDGPFALNPTADVRQLRFDVPRWVADGMPGEGPERRATLVVVFRDPRTQRCRFIDGTPATLFVVQSVHHGLDPREAAREHGLEPETVGALAADLADRGLLVSG